jgi:hypothetical protein
LPQDALDAAVNPANMVFLGKRYDLGIAFFNPNRQYTVTGNPSGLGFGLAPGTVKSDSKWFVIPSFGANWMLDADSSIGLSIYGNGGMNTDYPTNTFGGSSPTGVDLMQLFIAPTYARKLAPQHALVSRPILAIQRLTQEACSLFSKSPLLDFHLSAILQRQQRILLLLRLWRKDRLPGRDRSEFAEPRPCVSDKNIHERIGRV